MPFHARVYRILIASPSDVAQERDIIVRVIQEWNDKHAAERQVALLPVRWETHAAPEYGHPQAVLNRQIVAGSDILIGVFWTRIGTRTDAAESGTLEEIELMVSQRKLVMLYFSQAPQTPDSIGLEQLKRLREFKTATMANNALVEQYSEPTEFRDKLSRQLDMQVRALMSTKESELNSSRTRGAEIQISFAGSGCAKLGNELVLESTYIDVTDLDHVPDYHAPTDTTVRNPFGLLGGSLPPSVNRNYYRDLIVQLQRQSVFHPFPFWLKNIGSIGARDVRIDLRLKSNTTFQVASRSHIFSRPRKDRLYGSLLGEDAAPGPDVMTNTGTTWSYGFDVRALQPQRELCPSSDLVIGAAENGKIDVEDTVYADVLAEPSVHQLSIIFKVARSEASASAILQTLGEQLTIAPLRAPTADTAPG